MLQEKGAETFRPRVFQLRTNPYTDWYFVSKRKFYNLMKEIVITTAYSTTHNLLGGAVIR